MEDVPAGVGALLFDRAAFIDRLLNVGDEKLAAATGSLDSAIADFNNNPDGARLSNVQSLFKTAYTAWQSTSEYDYFGPAANAQPTLSGINIFPTNTQLIDNNISSGNNNVGTFANTAARGFPALDYLLFGAGANTLTGYTTDAEAASRLRVGQLCSSPQRGTPIGNRRSRAGGS